MIYFLCLSVCWCLSLIVLGPVNIKICYIYLCVLCLNVKDVNSRCRRRRRRRHRRSLSLSRGV